MKIKQIKVEEGGREMTVFIPQSGDKSYDDYLEEAEIEKTKDQLKKRPKPQLTAKKEDVVGALKEYKNYLNREKLGMNRRYY